MVENIRTRKTAIWMPREPERRTFFAMVGISLLCHVLVLSVFIWRPGFSATRRLPGPVVNVSLVSLPGPAAGTPDASPRPVAKKAASKAPTPKAVPVQKATKPVVKETVSLKKPTPKARDTVKAAIAKIQKEVTSKEAQTDSVDEAIQRLKEQVGQQEAGPDTRQPVGVQGVPGGIVGGGGGGGGEGVATALDLYCLEIAFNHVNRNWAFPDSLVGGGKLAAKMVFRVMPDGEIRDIRFIERSGNRLFDEAAYKAIAKSNPVRPHPPGVSRRYVEIAINFTPEGLR